MSVFQNGHVFQSVVRCVPPRGKNVPWVEVELAGPSHVPTIVVGKMDTGAFQTFLTFDTARRLGIQDPRASALATRSTKSATGHPIAYYVHRVFVRIVASGPHAIPFSLLAAVSNDIRTDLFGMDWLDHVCLAIDRQAVHVLAD